MPTPLEFKVAGKVSAEEVTCQMSGYLTLQGLQMAFQEDRGPYPQLPLSKQVYSRFQKLLRASDCTRAGKFQIGFCNRIKGQMAPSTGKWLNCDPEVSRWLSPLVGTAGSQCNPVMASFPAINTPDRIADGSREGTSGRLTFLLSLDRLVPLVENRTFLLQLQAPLGCQADSPPPHQAVSV